MALKSESKNRIEVIGEGIVDAVGLAKALRKKVGFADLVSVEEVKEESRFGIGNIIIELEVYNVGLKSIAFQ